MDTIDLEPLHKQLVVLENAQRTFRDIFKLSCILLQSRGLNKVTERDLHALCDSIVDTMWLQIKAEIEDLQCEGYVADIRGNGYDQFVKDEYAKLTA